MNRIEHLFEKYNLRFIQTVWICSIHIIGIMGAFQSTKLEKELLFKYLLAQVIWHYIALIGITGGAHRLWAHKSYQASFTIRVYLMLANTICFQGTIWDWARDHRLHHKFSDTNLDPHDSNKGFWHSHIGWTLALRSKELIAEGQKLDLSDLDQDKIVMFQKRNYYKLAFVLAFIIPMISGSLISDRYMFNLVFLGFTRYMFCLNATWCVNSICHIWGSRTWNKNIQARDNIFISLLTLGEGWHNWHHEHPKDWRGSKNEWWMLNPTFTFIWICDKLGLASTKQEQFQKMK